MHFKHAIGSMARALVQAVDVLRENSLEHVLTL
jgi:hypothetical protein